MSHNEVDSHPGSQTTRSNGSNAVFSAKGSFLGRRRGESERAALIFLPFAIALPQFAPFTAENARNTLGRPLADCHTENGLISYPRRKKQSCQRLEVDWKSNSFSYRAHLPFDSQVATLPLTPARRVLRLTAWTNSHVAFRTFVGI